MAIKRITPMSQIMQYMQDEISAYEAKIIERLQYLGEKCVIHARKAIGVIVDKQYKDHTGNLRSSVGYVIVRNGAIISGSDFSTVAGGSEGSSEGKSFAKEVASKFNKGIVLIVVAGMNYAAYVEAKGYDVLTSSEMMARRELPKLLEKLSVNKK